MRGHDTYPRHISKGIPAFFEGFCRQNSLLLNAVFCCADGTTAREIRWLASRGSWITPARKWPDRGEQQTYCSNFGDRYAVPLSPKLPLAEAFFLGGPPYLSPTHCPSVHETLVSFFAGETRRFQSTHQHKISRFGVRS
jgi:hypothetical protein